MWLIFVAYLLLRRYGGPGSEKLVGGGRALRHGQRAVRVLVGQRVADRASEDHRGHDAGARHGRPVLVVRRCAFLLLFVLLLAARVRLENAGAELDELYLALED